MIMFPDFNVMRIMFMIVFTLVFCMIIAVFVRIIRQWNYNNHQPVLTVDAACVSKREEVTHHWNNHMMHHTTWYYVTFEVESGDRMELGVSGRDYGMIAEGDYGRLTFQGTRFLGFERM